MIDQLNLAVRNLVRAVMAMPDGSVRPSDQTAPAGGQTDEFATVKIIDCRGLGFGALNVVDAVGGSEEEIQQVQKFTASVQFFKSPTKDPVKRARYSNAAFDRASRLGQLLKLSASTAIMQSMGLGLIEIGNARNLSALADAAWESRGQVDLTFDVINREALPIATIISAPITLSVEEPDGADETRNFEVTA